VRKILRIFLGSFGQSPKLHSCIEYGGGFDKLSRRKEAVAAVTDLVEATIVISLILIWSADE